MDGHAPFDPAADSRLFIMGKIVPGGCPDQGKDFLDIVSEFVVGNYDFLGGANIGRPHVFDEFTRDLFHTQDKIYNSRVNGAPGHTIVFSRFRVLNHGNAPFTLDGLQTQGAVRRGAGKDNADCLFTQVFSHRPEKTVNGQVDAAGFYGDH